LLKLDDWVFHNCLKLIDKWQDKDKNLIFFINISAIEFHHYQNNIYSWLHLLSHRTINKNIIFEITEDFLIKDSTQNFKSIRKIQETGINLSIDDFGTGYSNFVLLKKINARYLKINKELVKNIHKKIEYGIIKAIIELAQNLGMKPIAEGVETEIQMQKLIELNCDYAQGFYFSHPLTYSDFMKKYHKR
jgi:EAL domain-containing protein (putative c-di-GMP-specific phosphodiesterase class I)